MTRKKVLQDHKRHGKAFIPPFQHMLGPLSEISWVKTMLPELLWIALIQDYHGLREGVALITRFTRIARKCSSSEKKKIFAAISALGELSKEERSCLQSEFTALGDLFEIQKALLPLIALYPECPLGFLYSVKPSSSGENKQNLERLKNLVGGMYNKISRDTMMVQATATWLAFDSGVLKVFKGLALAKFPEIEKYPRTELSEKVAASIRSSIYMFFTEPHYPESSSWPKYFWNRGIEVDKCYFEESSSSEHEGLSKIEELIRSFIKHARLELKERWEKWTIDLSQNEIHEIVGALLARQVTLSRQMAENPPIWNGHVAPLILRAMADVYISLAWVLKDPLERSRKFVLYGLGQAKLHLEHRKAQIDDREPTSEKKILIEASEDWINSQRFTFLTEVNVGSWSGIPTRQMAEEADCIDFYNYVYNPFSACTHSMWHHIARYNLRQCANPLHQYHQVPEDPEFPMDPYNLYLSAKYLQKTFSAFDGKFGIKVDVPSAFDHLCEGLDRLSDTEGDERERVDINLSEKEDA